VHLISSSYWAVYKFFASQSQHKYKIIIFFSGDVNDEANFSFFILLHKRAKPALILSGTTGWALKWDSWEAMGFKEQFLA
jgi:hypothetical protein